MLDILAVSQKDAKRQIKSFERSSGKICKEIFCDTEGKLLYLNL